MVPIALLYRNFTVILYLVIVAVTEFDSPLRIFIEFSVITPKSRNTLLEWPCDIGLRCNAYTVSLNNVPDMDYTVQKLLPHLESSRINNKLFF